MIQAQDIGRLVVSCRDRRGIVAAISAMLAELGANIISSAQHSSDPENGMFFMRMVVHFPGFEAERRASHIDSRRSPISSA